MAVNAAVSPQASESTPAMNEPASNPNRFKNSAKQRCAGGAHGGMGHVDQDRCHRADGAGQQAAQGDEREADLRGYLQPEPRGAAGHRYHQQRDDAKERRRAQGTTLNFLGSQAVWDIFSRAWVSFNGGLIWNSCLHRGASAWLQSAELRYEGFGLRPISIAGR